VEVPSCFRSEQLKGRTSHNDATLLQLRALGFGFLRDGNVRVSVFTRAEDIYGFVSWIRTTFDSECTRSTASLLPSGDQWNWTIWSDLKFVI
jgi:hypothetical protein